MLILMRSTTACNLRCRYCSASCGDGTRQDINVADCRLLLEQLPTVLHQKEHVDILWHGGEPTILDPKDFVEMQSVFFSLQSQGFPVHCLMQTNGFFISEAWLDALSHFNVGVGVSIDGPMFLHDAMRIDVSGNGTYARVMKTVDTLRRHDIAVSLLCTVRQEHVQNAAAIVNWLMQADLPIRFNPLLRLGRSSDAISSHEYFEFLQYVLIQALERGFTHPIAPLEWMLSSVITEVPPTECSYNGSCGVSIFSYGPDGIVGACNRSDEIFGNLHDTPLFLLRESTAWNERRHRVRRLKEFCGDCPIWTFCHGGCPEAEGDMPDQHACEARRTFFTWLRVEGVDAYRKALLRRRELVREALSQIRHVKAVINRQAMTETQKSILDMQP